MMLLSLHAHHPERRVAPLKLVVLVWGLLIASWFVIYFVALR